MLHTLQCLDKAGLVILHVLHYEFS